MSKTKEEYSLDSQMSDMVESTAELIDMHFTQFAQFIKGKNVGTLKAYRLLLERNLAQLDLVGKQLTESKTTSFNVQERIKLGNVYGAVNKIIDRMGYIDFIIQELSIDFSKLDSNKQ